MDGQLSFASLDFAGKKKRTKRDVFLAEMAAVVPWSVLESLIEPHYPKVGPQGGRRPFPIAVMLRIYCLQHWYNLSDPGAEEALYDIQSMRAFCNLELGRDPIPDETTILNFRHLLETHGLTKAVFEAVADHLEARGALLRGGTSSPRFRLSSQEGAGDYMATVIATLSPQSLGISFWCSRRAPSSAFTQLTQPRDRPFLPLDGAEPSDPHEPFVRGQDWQAPGGLCAVHRYFRRCFSRLHRPPYRSASQMSRVWR